MNYSNQYYKSARYLNRKRQIVDQVLNDLHAMQIEMIEDAVSIKQAQGFPEACEVIDYIRTL